MNITIRWGSGWMTVDAVRILYDMPLRDFKKWCKMLAQFGEEADKDGIVKDCQREIQFLQDDKQAFEAGMHRLQKELCQCAYSTNARKIRANIRVLEKRGNDAVRKLSSLEKKYSWLKDVLRL